MEIYKGIEKEVIRFFKEAFWVEGEVKILRVEEINNFKIIGVVKLNDSKRKTFYIGLLKKEIK